MGGELGAGVVRVLGVASSTRGFCFAVTEGPRRLLTYGCRRVPAGTKKATEVLEAIIRRSRPCFLAFNREGAVKKRRRGRRFVKVVAEACARYKVRIVPVTDRRIRDLSDQERPTKWDVACAVAALFAGIAHKLPPKRKPWQSEDDRIEIFLALAAAVRGWDRVNLRSR